MELGPTSEGGGTDYPFRARVTRSALAVAMVSVVQDLDYSNFKGMTAKELGHARAHSYGKVWDALHDLSKEPTKAAKANATTESAKQSSSGLAPSFGGVIVDERGQVLVVAPKGKFGGYAWTFPKGRPDDGETPEQTAIREVFEETGIKAAILCKLLGVHRGTTTENTYFVMTPTGGAARPGDEIETVKWVTPDEARRLFGESNATGRERDRKVLEEALAAFRVNADR